MKLSPRRCFKHRQFIQAQWEFNNWMTTGPLQCTACFKHWFLLPDFIQTETGRRHLKLPHEAEHYMLLWILKRRPLSNFSNEWLVKFPVLQKCQRGGKGRNFKQPIIYNSVQKACNTPSLFCWFWYLNYCAYQENDYTSVITNHECFSLNKQIISWFFNHCSEERT